MDYLRLLEDIEKIVDRTLEAKLDVRFAEFENIMEAKLDVRFAEFEKKMDAKLTEMKVSNERDHQRMEREIRAAGQKVDRLYNVFAMMNEILMEEPAEYHCRPAGSAHAGT